MKTNYNLFTMLAVALLFSMTSWSQATIVQWNFNGTSDTTVPGGAASPSPSVGAGTFVLVGGTSSEIANGNTDPGTTDTETTTPPNYAVSTSNYAALGTENKNRGAEFDFSTAGQAGITFKFEQRLSNTSANTYVVQYTADRTAAAPVWVDAQTFTFTPAASGTGDQWYNGRVVDLTAATALDNNPNVGVRVMAAFDPIAGNYIASKSTSTYAVTGKVRFDMVTVISATTLGLPNFNMDDSAFTISPNPSHNQVVNFSEAHDIEVYDTTGKVIFKAKNASSVDTKSFNTGVYFIKTETGVTKKLIVK